MIDRLAGLFTQIHELKEKLKKHNPSKNPKLYKETLDALEAAEKRYAEQRKRKDERAKAKEETPKAEASTQPTEVVKESLTTSPEVTKESTVEKFAIDSRVEPIRGTPGSWGVVIREANINGDPLCYVKWMEGNLKEAHGGYGGYYPSDLRLKVEAKDSTDYVPREEVYNLEADLKSNYETSIKNLEEEHKTALEKGEAAWAHRLEEKINGLRKAYDERFPKTAEVTTEAQFSELSDWDKANPVQAREKYSREFANTQHSAGSLERQYLIDKINKLDKFLATHKPEQKEAENGSGGTDKLTVKDFTPAHDKDPQEKQIGYGGDRPYGWSTAPKTDESSLPLEASLNKNSINITIAEKLFVATPLGRDTLEGSYGYDVALANGNRLFKITTKEDVNEEGLTNIIKAELAKESKNKCNICNMEFDSWPEYDKHKKEKHGPKMAKLTGDLAFLKKGTLVSIISEDRSKKQVKFASLDNSLRGWCPASKVAAFDVPEANLVDHDGHKDEVLSQSGNELLVTCPANSINVIWRVVEAPPATSESLNPDVASFKEAAACNQCEMLMINGVPCHETGCPNQRKQHQEEFDIESAKKKPHTKECVEANDRYPGPGELCICDKKTASLFTVQELKEVAQREIQSHIRHEDGKWVIYSHDYKKKLGTYDSKEAATKRLREIEYFKHQGSLAPLSKKEAKVRSIRREMEQGILPNPYLIAPEDVGHMLDLDFGIVQSHDVGKYIFLRDNIIQMENDEQKREREQKVASKKESSSEVPMPADKCEECGKELGPEAFLSKWPVCRKCTKKRHEKAVGRKADQNTQSSLEQQVQGFRDRMQAISERLATPPAKTADLETTEDLSNVNVEDLTKGILHMIDLLESKVGEDVSANPEVHSLLEELENKVWEAETTLGIKPSLPEHEKAEPEHAEVVKEIEQKEEPVEKESEVKVEADSVNTPPTTIPPVGFRYAWDPKNNQWILVQVEGATGGY